MAAILGLTRNSRQSFAELRIDSDAGCASLQHKPPSVGDTLLPFGDGQVRLVQKAAETTAFTPTSRLSFVFLSSYDRQFTHLYVD